MSRAYPRHLFICSSISHHQISQAYFARKNLGNRKSGSLTKQVKVSFFVSAGIVRKSNPIPPHPTPTFSEIVIGRSQLLGVPLAWRRRQATAKWRWGRRKWRWARLPRSGSSPGRGPCHFLGPAFAKSGAQIFRPRVRGIWLQEISKKLYFSNFQVNHFITKRSSSAGPRTKRAGSAKPDICCRRAQTGLR